MIMNRTWKKSPMSRLSVQNRLIQENACILRACCQLKVLARLFLHRERQVCVNTITAISTRKAQDREEQAVMQTEPRKIILNIYLILVITVILGAKMRWFSCCGQYDDCAVFSRSEACTGRKWCRRELSELYEFPLIKNREKSTHKLTSPGRQNPQASCKTWIN